MKLKDTYLTHEVDGTQVVVNASGDKNEFHGLVKSNATAGFIISLLKEDVTIDSMVNSLLEKYKDTDITKATALQAVNYVVNKLKEINALDD